MNQAMRINRRFFVIGSAAVGGGLALGLKLPGEPDAAVAQASEPEVNAWVVIRPDETVVIRVAKSEMGQGTITGLAQLVAEELECDWSKVSIEYPTPGQNLARKQAWGTMFTAGSRGIRESQELVRKGGAAARQMLIQAAANSWNVPGFRVSRGEGRHYACALPAARPLSERWQTLPVSWSRQRTSRSRILRTGKSPASR